MRIEDVHKIGNEKLFLVALGVLAYQGVTADQAVDVLAARGNVIEDGKLVKRRRVEVLDSLTGERTIRMVDVSNGKVQGLAPNEAVTRAVV